MRKLRRPLLTALGVFLLAGVYFAPKGSFADFFSSLAMNLQGNFLASFSRNYFGYRITVASDKGEIGVFYVGRGVNLQIEASKALNPDLNFEFPCVIEGSAAIYTSRSREGGSARRMQSRAQTIVETQGGRILVEKLGPDELAKHESPAAAQFYARQAAHTLNPDARVRP